MDFTKEYSDAHRRARELWESGNALTKKQMEIVFPELGESEDERIINQLITLVNSTGEVLLIPTNKEELIAYLEKQKESLHISETCKNNADSFTDEDERIRKNCIHFLELQKGHHASTIEIDECIAWLEKQKEPENVSASTMIPSCWAEDPSLQKEQKLDDVKREWWNKGYLEGRKNAHIPARELGLPSYWDFQQEQKPVEWSELDKGILKDAITATDLLGSVRITKDVNQAKAFRIAKDWLEHLPERFNLQPKQKWSEEDDEMLSDAIFCVREYQTKDKDKKLIRMAEDAESWLKALRPPQYCENCKLKRSVEHWKPSEEQMEALRRAVNKLAKSDVSDSVRLSIMYDNLKKLI